MKKLLLLLSALVVLAACNSNSSNLFSVATGEEALSTHNVKCIVTEYYTFKDGAWEDEDHGLRDTIRYSPNGLLTEEGIAHSRRKYIYKYDSLNRVDTIIVNYYPGDLFNNPIEGYRVFSYDDSNRIHTIVEYDRDFNEVTLTLYRYIGGKRILECFDQMFNKGTKQYTVTDIFKNNRITKSTYESKIGNHETLYSYDQEGHLIRDVSTYKGDDGDTIYTYNYEDGLLRSSDISGDKGRLHEYIFNDRGEWIKDEVFYQKGHKPISKTVRTIEYY